MRPTPLRKGKRKRALLMRKRHKVRPRPRLPVDWFRTARRFFLDRADWTPDLGRYALENRIDLDALLDRDIVVGLLPCRFAGNGHFNFPREGGERAAVIEARGQDDATTIDLVAWRLDDAGIFASFWGAPLLGMAQATNPSTWSFGRTLRLFRSPLKWLEEKCDGAVVLDHRLAPLWLRDVPGAITCESIEHAQALDRMLNRPFDRARILFPEAE